MKSKLLPKSWERSLIGKQCKETVHSRTIEAMKQKLTLSPVQREALVGLLLGDGCLETQNQGRTYRLKLEQSFAHQAYVQHLYGLFQAWVLTPPRIRPVVSRGHRSENLAFQTVSHAAFRFYAQQFYVDGKKCAPRLIDHWLTPRGLAYWFMDDGSIKSSQSKGVLFNTHGFYRSDVERLIGVLQTKFDLQCGLRQQRDGCQIYISGASFERFAELIDPYLIAEMRYKLPSPRRTRSKDNTIA